MAQKNKKISFRITEEQYEKLVKDAKTAGIRNGNVSEYIRRQVEEVGLEDLKRREHIKEIQYQIRKIGVNINQIVRRNNSRLYFKSDKEELIKDLKEIQRLMVELSGQKQYL